MVNDGAEVKLSDLPADLWRAAWKWVGMPKSPDPTIDVLAAKMDAVERLDRKGPESYFREMVMQSNKRHLGEAIKVSSLDARELESIPSMPLKYYRLEYWQWLNVAFLSVSIAILSLEFLISSYWMSRIGTALVALFFSYGVLYFRHKKHAVGDYVLGSHRLHRHIRLQRIPSFISLSPANPMMLPPEMQNAKNLIYRCPDCNGTGNHDYQYYTYKNTAPPEPRAISVGDDWAVYHHRNYPTTSEIDGVATKRVRCSICKGQKFFSLDNLLHQYNAKVDAYNDKLSKLSQALRDKLERLNQLIDGGNQNIAIWNARREERLKQ